VLFKSIDKKITVVPYEKRWKEEFKKAYNFYSELLEGLDVSIEHVGSTSVEGLRAKPILDIDIIVPNSQVCLEVIEKLTSVGYEHTGNLGVEGREAFRYSEDNEYIHWMKHHLYVCIEGSENLVNHLLLRNHLRNNKSAAEEYGKLKQELAEKYPNDIDAYVKGKTSFIINILEKEGMDKEALNRITRINKKDK